MRENRPSRGPNRPEEKQALWLFAFLVSILTITFAASFYAPGKRTGDASSALVSLGRQIFFDRHLSFDGTISCASCHRPELAFTDGQPLAHGVSGKTGTRNTPSLLASREAERTSFFWDGRRSTLTIAVLDPFTNPVEMGLKDQGELFSRISASTSYKEFFRKAFGDDTADANRISAALTAYLSTLKGARTDYDRYASDNDANALTPQAMMGMSIFSGKGQCATCHSLKRNTFTDHAFHRTGVGLESVVQDLPKLTASMLERRLRDDDLGPWVATHPKDAQLGRFNVTHKVADIETFATPSLRHVSLTAPYMHDGSVQTLEGAIDREVYYRSLDTGYPIGLTTQERKDLKAFLEAL